LYGYFAAMAGLVVAAIWLIMRLVVKRKIRDKKTSSQPLRQADIKERLREAQKTGVSTAEAQAELQELASRQESGSVHLCFFGEISTGKSSLIKALIPEADVAISAVGGSTIDIRHYRWRDDKGRQILLTDVPGSGGLEAELDKVAEEEAMRSQLVLFVCDGDLTRAARPCSDCWHWKSRSSWS
jgi:predicted GTPase